MTIRTSPSRRDLQPQPHRHGRREDVRQRRIPREPRRTEPPICGSAFVVHPAHIRTNASTGKMKALTQFEAAMRDETLGMKPEAGDLNGRAGIAAPTLRGQCSAGDQCACDRRAPSLGARQGSPRDRRYTRRAHGSISPTRGPIISGPQRASIPAARWPSAELCPAALGACDGSTRSAVTQGSARHRRRIHRFAD